MILNFLFSARHGPVSLFALVLFGLPVATHAQARSDSVEVARRLASITSIAVDEYALGVDAGRVIKQDEFAEATLFLQQAHDIAQQLPEPARASAVATVDRLAAAAQHHEAPDALQKDVTFLRSELERTLGASLDPMPSAPPSLARGRRLFGEMCAQCHGPSGMGNGPLAKDLTPPPANLTDFGTLRGTSPIDFYRKVSVGVAGTAMPSFSDRLSVDDRWALALYASGLRYTEAERARGEAALRARCPDCLALISGLSETADASDDSLAALLASASGDSVSDPTVGAMVAFARTAPAAEVLGGDARLQALDATHRMRAGVVAAATLAAQGRRDEAGQKALDAYLVFERVENTVGARDEKAVASLEQAFARFRTAIARGTPGDIGAARGAVEEALDHTVAVMSGENSATVLFGQSLLIILREGLEAILILAALAAVVTKSGAPERRRELGWGAVGGIGASLLMAAGFATVFRYSTLNREAMEGITLLLAAVVLFSVASWLVSKIEAEKWKAFVGAKMQKALSSRGTFALAGVAFLAVFREGVETVLFYAALYGTAANAAGIMGVSVGILSGFAILIGIYYGITRYGLRLPLKPFFAVTGVLLSVMTFSFVGQGVAELQAAGWVPATPLHWLPSIPAVGIFPTVQTAAAQAAMLTVFVLAIAWIFRSRPVRAPAPTLRHPPR